MNEIFTFNHSGKTGDIILSLYFCLSLCKKYNLQKFNFNIQITKQHNNQIDPTINQLTLKSANYLLPLLTFQPYINNVTISQQLPIVNNLFNLNKFRQLPINVFAGNICNYYYGLYNGILERNFDKKILFCNKRQQFTNKIIICYTTRYRNINVNLKCLQQFKENMIFIGLDDEYNDFINNNFSIERYNIINMLDAAQVLNSCNFMISNQNGLFAIAELLKINRILISPQFMTYNYNRSM